MRKIRLFFFLFVLSSFLFAKKEDSFVKINKLKSIIVKSNPVGNKSNSLQKNVITTTKINKLRIPLNQKAITPGEKSGEKTEEDRVDVLGVILSKAYKAALISLNEDYIFLKEGEKDEYSDLKVLKITAKKVTIFLHNKKKEIEVENE